MMTKNDQVILLRAVKNIAGYMATDEGSKEKTESFYGLSEDEVIRMAHDAMIDIARDALEQINTDT